VDPKDLARQIELLKGRIGDELLEAGVASFPALLLAYQDLLYLSPVELNTIEHFWMDWSIGEGFSSVEKVARRVGLSPRRLQGVLKGLRERDLLVRAGEAPPPWILGINAAVRDEVAAYCRITYGDKAPSPPFGYLLAIEQKTSWGMQEENAYSFFPLLTYLRALYRENIRPLRQPRPVGAKQSSPPSTRTVVGGRTGVHPRGEAEITPMVMATANSGNGKAAPSVSTPSTTFFDPTEGIRLVLAHFLNRVAERWPTPGQPGQPPTQAHQRYEVTAALLSPGVSPETVSRAPAEVVEELVILSWVLWSQEPVDLASAIDRALERAGASPVRRLAFTWPEMPYARVHQKQLARLLKSGQSMNGQFRHAFRLFVILNRLNVGPVLADQFLEVCRELRVDRVTTVLEMAFQAGRAYVSLKFLRRGVALLGSGAQWALPSEDGQDDGDGKQTEDPPVEESPERQEGQKRGIVSNALRDAIWSLGTADDVRNLLSIMFKLGQTGLGWDDLLDCVKRARKATRREDPEALRWFYDQLCENIRQQQRVAGLVE